MSNIISQNIKFRESVIKYAIKYNNNSKAARKYNLTREYVRFWRNRYDGSLDSLKNSSRAPLKPVNKQPDRQLDIVRHTKLNKLLKCLLLLKEKVIYLLIINVMINNVIFTL